MEMALVRSYSPVETEGVLLAPPLKSIYTIERPLVITDAHPAGKPFYSCVPEGEYDLVPYERQNGHKVWCMVNESLGVYFAKADRRHGWQRYKCLIHSGNTVDHSSGCVLPGVKRGVLAGQRAVLKSGFRAGYAMDMLAKLLGPMSKGHTLTITAVNHV